MFHVCVRYATARTQCIPIRVSERINHSRCSPRCSSKGASSPASLSLSLKFLSSIMIPLEPRLLGRSSLCLGVTGALLVRRSCRLIGRRPRVLICCTAVGSAPAIATGVLIFANSLTVPCSYSKLAGALLLGPSSAISAMEIASPGLRRRRIVGSQRSRR